MRLLVTGSRDWSDVQIIEDALSIYADSARQGAERILVHGGARGADRIAGSMWRGWGLTEETHLPDWNSYGVRAGYVRNAEMVASGIEVCLAFILDQSRGATMCADLAARAGIKVYRWERAT